MKIKTIYFHRETESYTMMVVNEKGLNDIEVKLDSDVAESLIQNFNIEKYDTPDFIHYEL